MSTDVQNVQFTELETIRWKQFTHMKDAGHTDIDIAITWHLKSAKQVQRLKKKAKQNGAYKTWADDKLSWIGEEFPELHAVIKKDNPNLAYVVMSRLYAKGIPTQIEETIKEISHKQIDVNVYTDAEKSVLDKAARLLDRKSKRKSASLH